MSLRGATGVLQDSVEELVLSVAMKKEQLNSSEAGSENKLEDSFDVDGFDSSDDADELGRGFSVMSQGGVGERVVDAKSEAQTPNSDVSEFNGTDVRDADRGALVGDKSDKDDVVSEESGEFDSGISLTVQTSVLGESARVVTVINGVDFGVSVSVHIFCSSSVV